ncbi:MAG: CoA transferase [Ottowia sp.]|uniref:CaiB/BaiF CoA transferase family protein n=1 Tax=Ottowia sp. TaxID=1898956 RepID=UPI003C7118C6
MNQSHRPLQGIVVVELGNSVAAPVAGQILAQLGAEVVKIEKPSGDDARRWGPPFLDGLSPIFQAVNMDKRSWAIDLSDTAQRTNLVSFIQDRADVVLQNARPGKLESLGLGATALCSLKPSLIYCNLGAFGSKGPLRDQPGYDPLMQAFSGIMSVVGEPSGPSVRVGPAIVDIGTGMWAALGIMAALLQKRDTGKGNTVDVSLFETAIGWMSLHAANFLTSGEIPKKLGSGQMGIAPYRAYQTADLELVVAAGNDKLFSGFADVLEHPEWTADPRFSSNPSRVRNSAVLNKMIEEIMLRCPAADWAARLEQVGVPCAPVQNVQQMLEHPQTQALDILQEVAGCSRRLVGLPISFGGSRPKPARSAPKLDKPVSSALRQR